jgi:hypothetical protein
MDGHHLLRQIQDPAYRLTRPLDPLIREGIEASAGLWNRSGQHRDNIARSILELVDYDEPAAEGYLDLARAVIGPHRASLEAARASNRAAGGAVARAREIVSAALGLQIAAEIRDAERARLEADRIRTLLDG